MLIAALACMVSKIVKSVLFVEFAQVGVSDSNHVCTTWRGMKALVEFTMHN